MALAPNGLIERDRTRLADFDPNARTNKPWPNSGGTRGPNDGSAGDGSGRPPPSITPAPPPIKPASASPDAQLQKAVPKVPTANTPAPKAMPPPAPTGDSPAVAGAGRL